MLMKILLLTFLTHISEKGCCVKLVRHAGTGEQNKITLNYYNKKIEPIFLYFVWNVKSNPDRVYKIVSPMLLSTEQYILTDWLACHKSRWIWGSGVLWKGELWAYKGMLCPEKPATLLHCYVYYVGPTICRGAYKGALCAESLLATLLCNDKFHVYYITLHLLITS